MDNIRIYVGKSNIADSFAAGTKAANDALAGLDGAKPNFAIVFATAGYNQQELLNGIVAVTGDLPLSGCSGEGVITGEGSDEGRYAVAVMLFSGNGIKCCNYIFHGLKADSDKAGRALLAEIKRCKCYDRGTLVLLADSMTVNTTRILDVLNADKEFNSKTLVLGGTAGDMMQFKKTYQYHNGKVYTDSMLAAYMTGDFIVDWVVTHGCEEVGLEQTVTKAVENKVVTVDGKSTWGEFREYLPNNPNELLAKDAFHLCIGEMHTLGKNKEDYLIIRMPVALDKDSGAMQFSVEIPEKTKIHFTRRDPQIIAEKTIQSFQQLLERNKDKKPIAILQFDCAGRGRVIFGESIDKIIFEPLRKLFSSSVPWIGFHTYGEIAPIEGKIFFHNFTAVIGVLFTKI